MISGVYGQCIKRDSKIFLIHADKATKRDDHVFNPAIINVQHNVFDRAQVLARVIGNTIANDRFRYLEVRL